MTAKFSIDYHYPLSPHASIRVLAKSMAKTQQ